SQDVLLLPLHHNTPHAIPTLRSSDLLTLVARDRVDRVRVVLEVRDVSGHRLFRTETEPALPDGSAEQGQARHREAQLGGAVGQRSEEHTSELQSHLNLV